MIPRRKAVSLLKKFESVKYFIFFAVIYRFALEWSYIKVISENFAYAGLDLNFSIVKFIESWIIYLALLFFSPKVMNKPSDYFFNQLLFLFLTPFLIFYAMSDNDRYSLYLVLMCVSLVLITREGVPYKVPVIKGSRKIALLVLILGVVAVTFWMIASGGLRYFNLDLSRVYEFRDLSGELISQGVMAYINIWATKIFGPMLIAYFLWREKYYAVVSIVLLHVLWFGISAHKSVLFYPILVIFVWTWFRYSKALAFVPAGLAFLVILSTGLFLANGNIIMATLFVRRLLIIPSQVTFIYYDFFSNNNFLYWSNSVGAIFNRYEYDLNAAKLIGEYMGKDMNANVSFLATGFMHAGIVGVVIYGVLVGYLFKIIDSIGRKGLPAWLVVASMIVSINSLLLSADLPTALLTHGIGVAIIFLFFLRSPSYQVIRPSVGIK